MATRKYTFNRSEVVDCEGQSFITPRVVFGYCKVDNFAQVYNENQFILTPTGNEKTTGFVSGDRLLFKVHIGYDGEVALNIVIEDTTYALKHKDGTDILSLEPGWYAAAYNGSAFLLDDMDLDEQDYVYCDYLIDGCIKVAENYTWYDIVPKTYREFRNDLTGDYFNTDLLYDGVSGAIFELRRGVVPESVVITYTGTDGVSATVPVEDYYIAGSRLVVTGAYYPTADKLECVCIRYDVENTIAPDLMAALLQHISEAYEGRGMCTSSGCPAALNFSSGVRNVYRAYKTPKVGG